MPFTGELGNTTAQPGSLGLGFVPLPVPTAGFGFLVHQISANQIRIIFSTKIARNAASLSAPNYILVSAAPSTIIPLVSFPTFENESDYTVILTLSQPLTLSKNYSLKILNVVAVDGITPCTGIPQPFFTNVIDPPKALGAYLSDRSAANGYIDIVFDRPTGYTTLLATATIQEAGGPVATLTLVPWSIAISPNTVRFSFDNTIANAASGQYMITFNNVIDYSLNTAITGTVPLTLALRAPLPITYAELTQAQIIDAFCDYIDNIQSRTHIRVYFSCPMSPASIMNVANWMITQNGNPQTIHAVTYLETQTNDPFFASADVQIDAQTDPTLFYDVLVTVTSADTLSATNPADYTGSMSSAVAPFHSTRALWAPARLLSQQAFTDTFISFRFDREMSFLNLSDFKVQDISFINVGVLSINITSSLDVLSTFVSDLLVAYENHRLSPAHPLVDIANIVTVFPGGTLASIIASLNAFNILFNDHITSPSHHEFVDEDDVVIGPIARDYKTAVTLAHNLRDAFLSHNANLGYHLSNTPSGCGTKLLDTIVINLSEMLDGAQYNVAARLFDVTHDRFTSIDHSNNINFSGSEFGVAILPSLASAVPRIGLVQTDVSVMYNADAIEVWFSKPMRQISLLSGNFIFSGAMTFLNYLWVDDRKIDVLIKDMQAISYTLSVVGFQDHSGNPQYP